MSQTISATTTTSTLGLHFHPSSYMDCTVYTSVSVFNDGEVWTSIDIHGLDESDARAFAKAAKKIGFEASPKKWWSTGKGVVKRKMDANRFTQNFTIAQGNARVQYCLYVDLA